MSRYRGPRLRVVRRLGELPGLSRKNPRRTYPPGQHGQGRRKRSEYAVRLEEKQKLLYNYGVTEKQLIRYMKKARRATGSTGQKLLELLEMRLDNTVFRLGMAGTIPGARQLVNHCHVLVNGRTVNIASYQCRAGDIISVRQKSKSLETITESLSKNTNVIEWLDWDSKAMEGKLINIPNRDQIPENIKEQLIVELYSK